MALNLKTLHVVLEMSCPLRCTWVVCVCARTHGVHASRCSKKNSDGFHFKHKSRSSGQCFFFLFSCLSRLLHPILTICVCYFFFLFVSVRHSRICSMSASHWGVFPVAYNICMYIICPWWRKKTTKKQKIKKNTDKKKITYCHVSQCGFEKSTCIFVSVWLDFEKKKKSSKYCMLCSGLWVNGVQMEGESGAVQLENGGVVLKTECEHLYKQATCFHGSGCVWTVLCKRFRHWTKERKPNECLARPPFKMHRFSYLCARQVGGSTAPLWVSAVSVSSVFSCNLITDLMRLRSGLCGSICRRTPRSEDSPLWLCACMFWSHCHAAEWGLGPIRSHTDGIMWQIRKPLHSTVNESHLWCDRRTWRGCGQEGSRSPGCTIWG